MTTIQPDQYLSLSDVAKLAPGRPSTNCVWRWCRKGVKARSSERIRLQHIRIGGQIYTAQPWLAEFGAKLADADARYFELCELTNCKRARQRSYVAGGIPRGEMQQRKTIEATEQALSEAGI